MLNKARQSFFEICIQRPVLTSMMSLALVVFGILGLDRLPVRELPDVDPAIVNVLTVYPGASPEVVEIEVTERLEEAISSADGIRILSSESREQASSITVEFVQGRDVDVGAQDVRDRVARVRGELPEDVDEPVISKQSAAAQPIIWIALFSDRHSPVELSKIADNVLKDRLQSVPGVSSIVIGGEQKFAIRLRLDPARMAAHGATVGDVERALKEQNVELPSGRVENADRELTIQVEGEMRTVAEFDRMIIRQDGTRVVRLLDIGHAEAGVEDERTLSRYNGEPTIGLGVVRQSRANEIAVAHGVKAKLAEIAPLLPVGMRTEFGYDSTLYVERAVYEVFETLGIAFALVVLTIFIFLRDLRATILPALSVPVSVLATFGVLYALGFSINIFTLLALVLAIGVVVDDSIVVLENMHRHIEDGMSPLAAASRTMQEIAFAIVTITLSLVAVFLPLAFLTGLTGRLLLEFAAALVAAVVVSAFVSLTLAPMVGGRVLRAQSTERHGRLYCLFERGFDGIARGYLRGLRWSLSHRFFMIMLVAGSLYLSWYCFANLESEFLPDEDKGWVLGLSITPQGSTPEYTDRMVRQMEEIIAKVPETEGYFSAVAIPFNGPGDATVGIMYGTFKPNPRRHLSDIVGGPAGLGANFFGQIEGAISFPVTPKAVDVGFGQPYQLILTHPNLETLAAYSGELIARMQKEGFLANIRSTFELTKPEARIEIDRNRAGALGVSIAEISRTLQILFGGEDLSEITLDGKQYEVIVQLDREARLTPSAMASIFVRSGDGKLVQLSNLVTIKTGAGPNQIERFQRSRSTTIEGTPSGVPLGTAVARTTTLLEETLPVGFGYDWKGEARNLAESSRDIYFLFILSIIVVYMVLAAQFESLVHPLTVMLALPLAFLGAFGLLYLLSWVNFGGFMLHAWTNWAPSHPAWAEWAAKVVPRIPSMTMNIFSQVGLVILIGLVTKNSILLVEFANQRRAAGLDAHAAMIEAGRTRLRPILMTSMATIAGILPIAFGFGDAGDSRRPLGVVAVGGLLSSTVLTLFVIPVFYTLFADIAARFGRGASGEQELAPKSE